jgi:flagellar hook-associated protein 3 FlgL
VETVSDQPDQLGSLLVDRAQFDQTQQIGANLGRAKTEVDTAERALQNAVKTLETALTAGVQAATGTVTVAQRNTIAVTVSGALEQLVALAGTTVEGRYVFSGDNYDTLPYTVDLTQPNGVSAYGGGQATREIMHPSGYRFAISRSADQIFDDPAGASVFAAVNVSRWRTVRRCRWATRTTRRNTARRRWPSTRR